MTSALPSVAYTQEERDRQVAAALGGEVYWIDGLWHLHKDGVTVSVPAPSISEPFDVDEWVELMRVAWERAGCRL